MTSPQQLRDFRTRLAWALVPVLSWEVAGRILALRTHLLPTPSRIALETYRQAPRLLEHAAATLYVLALGLLTALAIGIPLGVAWAVFRWPGSEALQRMKAAQAAPLIAFAPLLWLWLTLGASSNIALAALLAGVPTVRATLRACRSAPGELLDLARLAGAGPGTVFWKIRWPSSLPVLIDGLMSAAPLALAGALAAEFVRTDRGLGYVLVASSFTADTPLLFSALALIGTISLAFHAGIRLIERLVAPPSSEAARLRRRLPQPGQ